MLAVRRSQLAHSTFERYGDGYRLIDDGLLISFEVAGLASHLRAAPASATHVCLREGTQC